MHDKRSDQSSRASEKYYDASYYSLRVHRSFIDMVFRILSWIGAYRNLDCQNGCYILPCRMLLKSIVLNGLV
jgi:hypothetical protein